MATVYVVNGDGTTEPMEPVVCKDEQVELQDILAKNYQLLPGDQIEPDDPCRWMLIKREMPVPDSMTGQDRWSVDFLFVDHNAVPTFVECKRFADTRSRREVIGQVLEYAANAQHLWSKESIRDYAEATAKDAGRTIPECLRELQVEEPDAVDAFFSRVEENLGKAVIRIVFFMEKAPEELKRLVEFLNTQMVASDVLLVEARQFRRNDVRIVVPQLFGFTERARQVKQTTQTPAPARWTSERLMNDATERGLDGSAIATMQKVIELSESLDYKVVWGRGRQFGSFNLVCPAAPRSLFLSIVSDGTLSFTFGNLASSQEAIKFRDKLKELVTTKLNFRVPEDYQRRYPQYPPAIWMPKADLIADILRELNPPQCG